MRFLFEVTLRINGTLLMKFAVQATGPRHACDLAKEQYAKHFPNQAKAATVDTWKITEIGER